MALFDVFDVAGTALSAQSLRLNLVSSNVANADSASSSSGETYRARHAVFESLVDAHGARNGGVRVRDVVESDAPLRREYRPDHPAADESGHVFLPNVNVIEELADMISASRSFQTSVEVMNTSKQLVLRTLSIGK